MIFGIYQDKAGYFCKTYSDLSEVGRNFPNARLIKLYQIYVDSLNKASELFESFKRGEIKEKNLPRTIDNYVN